MNHVRKRFYVAVVLAAASVIALLATLVWPQWIELLFGVEPDGGSGESEWGFAAGLVVASIAFSGLAVREVWRARRVA